MSKYQKTGLIDNIFVAESENIFKTPLVQQCFDIVGVFVVALDMQARLMFINKMGRELLAYGENEIIGSDFTDSIIAARKKEETREIITQFLNNKAACPEDCRYYICAADGKERIIEARNSIIQDKDGKLLGLLISGKDVTSYLKNQRDLKKNIVLYRILANNIPDINLYLFDKDLRIVLAEGGEMKNNGFSRDYFEGKRLDDIPNKRTRDLWRPLFVSAIEGKEASREYRFNNYYYLMWVLPLQDNSNEEYSGIAITKNVTDEKISEKRLKRSIEKAQEANQAKSEFMARVSHEIRTPLNAILGFTEQLIQSSLDKQQSDYVKIIDKSSEHLLSLINEILVLSKIEAQQINLDKAPFKIEQTTKYVFSALEVNAAEKNLKFTYQLDDRLDMVLIGDSFRLRQILINMLSNAIKFTERGSVEMHCSLVNEKDDEVKVKFDIIDTGIGIRPENLETIFEEFKQANSGITRKYGGTGLGLTICKKLIELQTGSLSVTSKENAGSRFTFTLPYKKGKKTDIVTKDPDRPDPLHLKNLRILLIDDDSVNRLLGKIILEKFNCLVDLANNGEEAIYLLNKNSYDIILLDIHLPDINGVDVAKYLRYEKKDALTKIVAVTAAVLAEDINRYYKAGINDFIVKPYREIQLYSKICELMKIKSQSQKEPKKEIILKDENLHGLYNLDGLRSMTGNDTAVMKKLLNKLIDNSENAIREFHLSLDNEDWKQIGETAHRMLPSYKHLKADKISSDLEELKNISLIDPKYHLVPLLVDKVIKEMLSLISDLKKEIGTPGAKK